MNQSEGFRKWLLNYSEGSFPTPYNDDDLEIAYHAGFHARDAEISELQDKLYHASREASGIKYELGHEIEELKKTLKIAEEFLDNIDHYDPIEDGLITLGEVIELIRSTRGVDEK